jgi:hypothetical protein
VKFQQLREFAAVEHFAGISFDHFSIELYVIIF